MSLVKKLDVLFVLSVFCLCVSLSQKRNPEDSTLTAELRDSLIAKTHQRIALELDTKMKRTFPSELKGAKAEEYLRVSYKPIPSSPADSNNLLLVLPQQVAVAYLSGGEAKFRVLKKEGSDYSPQWEWKPPAHFMDFGVAFASVVTVRDINKDGKLEIILAITTGISEIYDQWTIFEWHSNSARVISPPHTASMWDGESIAGTDVQMRDIDGDGIDEFVCTWDGRHTPKRIRSFFKWNGQTYSQWKKENLK